MTFALRAAKIAQPRRSTALLKQPYRSFDQARTCCSLLEIQGATVLASSHTSCMHAPHTHVYMLFTLYVSHTRLRQTSYCRSDNDLPSANPSNATRKSLTGGSSDTLVLFHTYHDPLCTIRSTAGEETALFELPSDAQNAIRLMPIGTREQPLSDPSRQGPLSPRHQLQSIHMAYP